MSSRHFAVYHPEDWTPPEGSWASSDAIRRTMLKNRNRDTRPEVAVRSACHRLGLRYRVAVRPIKDVRRTADMVFPRQKIAVFVDGCYWHACAEHFVMPSTNVAYWQDKIGHNRARDADTDLQLAARGWKAIRVWEHEDPETAAARIALAVRANG